MGKKEKKLPKNVVKMNFNPYIAKDVGVEEAIMYSNIEYWVTLKEANKDKRSFKDGEYWVYNSVSAFNEIFFFWTPNQIDRILKKLEKEGYIKSGNFNKAKYDRTKWYKCISAKAEMEIRKCKNAFREVQEPIPDSKQQIKNTDNPMGTSLGTKEKIEKKIEENSDEDILKKIMGQNINEVMGAFYEADKGLSGGAGFGRKTYRDAAEFLIKQYGLKDVLDLVAFSIAVRGKPFAPVITNPVELKEKLVKLKAFIEKEKGKTKKIFWGSDFSK